MGTNSSTSSDRLHPHNPSSKCRNSDLVVRDHTFDYDLSGIQYLKAHDIPQLFQDLTGRLLSERPLDSLRFIRNILIHKVIAHQDHKHRTLESTLRTTEHSITPIGTDVASSASPPTKRRKTLPKKQIEPLRRVHSDRLNPVESSDLPSFDIIELGDSRYDADKLLESRTTKRVRSYSDSAILFDELNAYSAPYSTDDIHINALSQPISMHKYNTTDDHEPVSQDTAALIMNDMNITSHYKNEMLQHLKTTQPNDLRDESPKSGSFGLIANRFQNKLKSLSHSAKSIPSKLKTQLQHIDKEVEHEAEEEEEEKRTSGKVWTESQSEHFDADTPHNDPMPRFSASDVIKTHQSTELYIDTEPHLKDNKLKSQPLALRRSRTMEQLPSGLALRHILSLSQRPCFGFDIGGSLTKISFFEPSKRHRWNEDDRVKAQFVTSSTKYGTSGVRDQDLSFPWRNGTFHFIHFQTHRMNEAVSLWKREKLLRKNEVFYATGGGAHKYSNYLSDELYVRVKKGDELKCLISGLNFLLTHVSDECYYLSDPASKEPSPRISLNIAKEGSVFPYLLVNVGSGVSILKVDSATQFERVSGSQIGGGTYWGLCRLCSYGCGENKENNKVGHDPTTLTFKKAFELAMKGDAKKVNMLVSDIYGGDYPQCNLPGDLVASAFGKCVAIKNLASSVEMGDISRALLDFIAMNCAQLAYLNAMRFKITRIIFAGNFLRQNELSMAMISYAIHYWSQGVMKACFLKHEGYFGSIGVMLLPDKELQSDDDHEDTGNNDNNNDNNNDTSNDNDHLNENEDQLLTSITED